ncbi:all-trans retinoic acid-induced differentiation factor isoform X2 [Nematostella vectensis]|nr:all-trans retinoic acid-induced differentiation factor isoform X2 [Nematostella vectensis]
MFPNISILTLQILILCFDVCSGDIFARLSKSTAPEKQRLSLLCQGCNETSNFIEGNCLQKQRRGRCCLDSNNVTIGLDLGNCSLTRVPDIHSLQSLSWLNLANNSQLDCSYSGYDSAYKGLKKLSSIYLPSHCNCPGGRVLWNVTKTKDSKSCIGQLNTCSVLNVTCPDNSDCVDNGPGFYECHCKPSWGGYRCLVKDGIPIIIILGSIAGAAIFTIAILSILMCKR